MDLEKRALIVRDDEKILTTMGQEELRGETKLKTQKN